MTKAFVDFNGVVPEKYDAVALSHKVAAEYGNQGVDFKVRNVFQDPRMSLTDVTARIDGSSRRLRLGEHQLRKCVP